MKKTKIILLSTLIIIMLSFPGCDRRAGAKDKDESIARTGFDSAAALEDSINYAALEPVDLPQDFPGEIHLYANAKNIKSFKSDKGFSVTLFTPDSLEKVVADYREYAELAQWRDEKVLELSDKTVLKYNIDSRPVAVQVVEKNSGCLITISTK